MKIALLDDYQDVAMAMAPWDRLPPECEVVSFHDHVDDEALLVRRLADFDVVMAMRERTPLPGSVIDQLPRLKLIVTAGMRNASIEMAAARRRGIPVCGTAGLPYPTAELAIGLILAWARRIPQEDRAMREGAWQTTIGLGLNGKVLGVIGLGTLGARVARIALAFEMEVLAWSQNLSDERAREVGVTKVGKDELLARADFVSIHLVLSDRSRHLIAGRELGLMKPTACLVNTSRSAIVDETALLEALRNGTIGGAALDVYPSEPLPAGHLLRTAPNTVLTPHLGYVTDETFRVFYGDALEDVEAFLKGQPVRVLNA